MIRAKDNARQSNLIILERDGLTAASTCNQENGANEANGDDRLSGHIGPLGLELLYQSARTLWFYEPSFAPPIATRPRDGVLGGVAGALVESSAFRTKLRLGRNLRVARDPRRT